MNVMFPKINREHAIDKATAAAICKLPIVWAAAELKKNQGLSWNEIAHVLERPAPTVRRWYVRYQQHGFDGLKGKR
jgi:hypothetical protein